MKLSSFLRLSSKTTNPQANPSVVYNLYSLPSFDDGRKCEVVHGSEIQSNKFIVPDKCILFNKLNVRFKRIWRIDNTEPNKIASTEFLPLVVDESIVDFHYCYYLLRSDRITDYLTGQNTNTSGSHKRIDPDNFFDIEVSLPPLEDQKRIGEVLSNLDMKIDINTSLNHYLEAMAKRLYDYWFVQFDFPDENGRPYKNSGGKMVWNDKLKREIPEGWELTPLFKGVDVQYGFPFSTDLFTEIPTDIPIVRIRDIMDGSTSAFYCGDVDDKYRLNKGDIVIGMDGNFHMNYWHSDMDYLNQRCVRLRPRSDSQISALQSLFETTPYIKAKEKNAKGSTVGHLSDKDLKDMWLIKPMSNAHFNPRVTFDSLLNKMIQHKEELLQLTKCRNELLPLLMNGQVSVKQLNNDLVSHISLLYMFFAHKMLYLYS